MTSVLTVLPELAIPALDNQKADVSDTPWWLSLIKAVLIFVYLLISTLLVIWFERRVIGRMQQRPGPNRTGPFGLLQTLADGMKSMLKEDVTPAAADKVIFTLAPLIAATMNPSGRKTQTRMGNDCSRSPKRYWSSVESRNTPARTFTHAGGMFAKM